MIFLPYHSALYSSILSDYEKDTDDLYQFDNQDIAKHEEYSPEIPESDYEEFMDDVFEQQYDDEDDQKH